MRRFALFLSLLLGMSANAAAQSRLDEIAAQSRLDEIAAQGVLRVGLTGDYRPFSQRDPSGACGGLDVDMAHALADALGVRLEIVPTTWAGLLGGLGAGKFDIGMGGISITLARQRTAFFSMPVMRVGKTPIARCGVGPFIPKSQ